jgi:hypothetical protein
LRVSIPLMIFSIVHPFSRQGGGEKSGGEGSPPLAG